VLAVAIAAAVAGLVSRTLANTATGTIAATAALVLIMGIAVFMILNQLNIASAIVEITYAALLGSVALGLALAFWLGGRDVAARLLDDAYPSGRNGHRPPAGARRTPTAYPPTPTPAPTRQHLRPRPEAHAAPSADRRRGSAPGWSWKRHAGYCS
jgi:hypothetical protein